MRFILDFLGIGLFLSSVISFFVPSVTPYGDVHYNYGLSLILLMAALILGLISNRKVLQILVFTLSIAIVLFSVYFFLEFSTGYIGTSHFFFLSFYLGLVTWLSSCLLVLRLHKCSSSHKSIFIISLIFLAGLSYYFLRNSQTIWNIYRDECGSHIIWMFGGNLALLICSLFYFRRNLVQEHFIEEQE